MEPIVEESWNRRLYDEFQKPYFASLNAFLLDEMKHYTIYPSGNDIYNAFNSTPFEKLKVVILGQDPYHGLHQAHGLAFSVQEGIALPPSLKNIFTELHDDIGCDIPQNGNLVKWAREGVFLLNTVLTVRASEAHSHKNRGWETFTDAVIRLISKEKKSVVFILWGKPAQQKSVLIDASKHHIITAPHPSPLSAYRGFFGSRPFSKSNDYLRAEGIGTIDWCL